MRRLLRTLATLVLAVSFAGAAQAGVPGAGFSHAVAKAGPAEAPGLYAVAQKLFAQNSAPTVDVSVQSSAALQIVTVTATAGSCRAVIQDDAGQILRSRLVEREADFDFYAMPAGTYRIAILDAAGTLQLQQTLVKR